MGTKRIYLIFIFLSSLFLYSCDTTNEPTSLENNKTLVITIQPLGNFSKGLTDDVYKELQKIHSNIVLNKSIEIPSTAYYPPRSRYRADSLIRIFRDITPSDHVTIALTNKDISTTKGKLLDYGIMGWVIDREDLVLSRRSDYPKKI